MYRPKADRNQEAIQEEKTAKQREAERARVASRRNHANQSGKPTGEWAIDVIGALAVSHEDPGDQDSGLRIPGGVGGIDRASRLR